MIEGSRQALSLIFFFFTVVDDDASQSKRSDDKIVATQDCTKSTGSTKKKGRIIAENKEGNTANKWSNRSKLTRYLEKKHVRQKRRQRKRTEQKKMRIMRGWRDIRDKCMTRYTGLSVLDDDDSSSHWTTSFQYTCSFNCCTFVSCSVKSKDVSSLSPQVQEKFLFRLFILMMRGLC